MTRPTPCMKRLLVFGLTALVALTASLARAGETITYIHWDALGSPVAATDEAGNVVWRESYRPYGERINNEAAAGPHTRWYTGHPQDEDTGLVYAGARYYDPVIGRFLGIDPVEFQENNLHSFNRYAYGNNNPYRYIDPDGRFALDTIVDAGFVIYDTGRFLGAAAAYGVGTVTGDSLLQGTGRQGIAETGLDLGASALGMAIPFAPSAVTRGVAKSAPPNPWGRRGSPAHRDKIGEAEQRLNDTGWNTVSGGSLREKKYGSRFPDLVMEKEGKQVAVQVGRATKGGKPVARERRAIQDLRKADEFDHVFFLGY